MSSKMSEPENNENCCESENENYSKVWLLVQWVGSFPKDAFDIINISDVVFDEYNSREKMKIGSDIMVRCGKIKSPAIVLQISGNTDALYRELRRLQKKILSETSTNIKTESENIPPKSKRRKYLDGLNKTKCQNKSTQTQEDNVVDKLIQENQKLKAELYESNKIINTMCKELNLVVQNAKNKILNHNESSNIDVETEKKVINHSLVSSNDSASFLMVEDDEKVLIGSGKTPISRYLYNQINWLSFKAATRKLLMAVFPRDILATHSLTGKPSPAFLTVDMPIKMRLDTTKVNDIVEVVSMKCGVSESMVRSVITTKCADENKMFKKRIEKIE